MSENHDRHLLDTAQKALDRLTQMQVHGPHDGVCWIYLRPDHEAENGLVSIRIDEEPMVAAYVHWFAEVEKLRAELARLLEAKQ